MDYVASSFFHLIRMTIRERFKNIEGIRGDFGHAAGRCPDLSSDESLLPIN